MKLSPLNFSRLIHQDWMNGQLQPANERPQAIEITVYECPKCGDRHDIEEDAEECCLKQPEADGDCVCPICAHGFNDYYLAADCCLWKDYGAPERWRMAAAMEAGSTWLEQLGLDS